MTQHLIMRGVIPRIRFVSDGTLSEYDFPFAIFKNSDLKVYFGSELQDSTTYTVSGAGESDGGTVTLSHVPESGVIITVTRDLPIERTSDFQEGGALRANTLNYELDYQIACQQQIADNLNRSMVLPPYAADSDVKLTLPEPSAGKAIVWNAAGTNLENSTVAVNALESTLKGYKDSAETAASTATTKASEATTQAITATTQAGIATAKAEEATTTLSSKANKDLDNLSQTALETLLTLNAPDYTAGISKTWNTDNTAESAGIIIAHDSAQVNAVLQATVNGENLPFYDIAHAGLLTISFSVAQGDIWKVYGGDNNGRNLIFYPMKGVLNV